MSAITYSIIVPVYNEEESLEPLFQEIKGAMEELKQTYEMVFVDDCSDDRSAEIMQNFEKQYPELVKIVPLNKRCGQTYALKQGLDQARGEMIITLDADLQNDPKDIIKMQEKMKEGFDCVCGWRKARQDTLLKAGLSKFGNAMQRIFTGMTIHDISCTLRMYRKHCVEKIALNWEGQHRFIPLSLSLQEFKVGEIVSHHRKRQYGISKYTHKRVFKVALDFFRILKTRGKK